MHYWVLEAVGLMLGIVTFGDLSHYTWWGVAVLLTGVCVLNSTASSAIPASEPCQRIINAAMVVSAQILVAVGIMSGMGCGMLNATFDSLGPWIYGVGNFALHYYPVIRAYRWGHDVAKLPVASVVSKSKWTMVTGDAAIIISVYTSLLQPADIYGCSISSPSWIGVSGAATALLLEVAVIYVRYSGFKK